MTGDGLGRKAKMDPSLTESSQSLEGLTKRRCAQIGNWLAANACDIGNARSFTSPEFPSSTGNTAAFVFPGPKGQN